MKTSLIHSALFGVAIGDALGVPVEFLERNILKANPVKDMQAFGTHNQPAGTWSDDSSLTFCLAEMLCQDYDIQNLGSRFVNWYEYGYWTPHGKVFDVGIATSQAIHRIERGENPLLAGGSNEMDNGNGSLMRILPVLLLVKELPIEERYKYVSEVSSLTHRHIRSILACFIYIELAKELLATTNKLEALENTKNRINDFLNNNPICSQAEIDKFHRILQNPIGDYNIRSIFEYSEDEIESSGYVVHSLEAAIWCLLKENTFEATVLRAVNLGKDTDTTAAIAGGLAGLLYGFDTFPQKWVDQLARKEDIMDLCNRLENRYK